MIVDDHPIIRQGMAALLSGVPGFAPIDLAASGDEALTQARQARPDVVLLDLSLGPESGLDVLRRLQAFDRSIPVLVMSMHDEALHSERALRAGAVGYVMKHEATEAVIDSIRRVLRGEVALSPRMQTALIARMTTQTDRRRSGVDALSDRELEVLRLIGLGVSSNDIANQLCRSVKTIEAHRASIRNKLGLTSNLDLIRFATLWIEDPVFGGSAG
jgi:DNA-binding NarL/FixJ family response regulator